MPLAAESDRKYGSTSLVDGAVGWDSLRIEHRLVGSGSMNPLTSQCTELVYILSGKAWVRRKGDGIFQEGMALPGSSWIVPAGTHETLLELDGSTECLHVFLPDTLIEKSALADYDLDPARINLAYVGGILDPVLAGIATTLRGMVGGEIAPADKMLADGLRVALAARLISHYLIDRTPRAPRPSLEPRRLRRVIDFIEARLSENISLDDLAREACLSPFHFARVFADTTGSSPHRYLTLRRVEVAKQLMVLSRGSLAEIALDAGFGSQANFTRVFRKATGITPGQYRDVHMR